MRVFAAAGAGFLLAVLWFDLMFDVQTRNHRAAALPPAVLASISTYYRRVTTEASPMGQLVAVVMALTILAIAAEIGRGAAPWRVGWPSLVSALLAIGLALGRTVRDAKRLGAAADGAGEQSRLARRIYRDHQVSFAGRVATVGVGCP